MKLGNRQSRTLRAFLVSLYTRRCWELPNIALRTGPRACIAGELLLNDPAVSS